MFEMKNVQSSLVNSPDSKNVQPIYLTDQKYQCAWYRLNNLEILSCFYFVYTSLQGNIRCRWIKILAKIWNQICHNWGLMIIIYQKQLAQVTQHTKSIASYNTFLTIMHPVIHRLMFLMRNTPLIINWL